MPTPTLAPAFSKKTIERAIKRIDAELPSLNTDKGCVLELDRKSTTANSAFWVSHPGAVNALIEAYREVGWDVKQVRFRKQPTLYFKGG